MKLNKRIGAMALSAALLMGTLAGCGPQEAADATPPPSTSQIGLLPMPFCEPRS